MLLLAIWCQIHTMINVAFATLSTENVDEVLMAACVFIAKRR